MFKVIDDLKKADELAEAGLLWFQGTYTGERQRRFDGKDPPSTYRYLTYYILLED